MAKKKKIEPKGNRAAKVQAAARTKTRLRTPKNIRTTNGRKPSKWKFEAPKNACSTAGKSTKHTILLEYVKINIAHI